MPTSHIVQILWLLVIAGCAVAAWKGGPPERIGAALVFANLLLSTAAQQALPREWVPVGGLGIDGLTALGLLGVVLIYGSLWLGATMILYAIQFALRAYYFVAQRPPDLFHATVNNIDFMGIMLCMLLGAAAAWRRRSRMSRMRPYAPNPGKTGV